MVINLLKPEIINLIRNKDYKSIKEAISDWQPGEILDLLTSLPDEEQIIFFRLLPKQQAADVFSLLDPDDQMGIIEKLKEEKVKVVLNEMDPDDRTAFFEEIPSPVMLKLLNLLSPKERKDTLKLLGYPEDSVGRLMTPDYVKIGQKWTVEMALKHIRKYGKDAETIDVIYVVDENNKLIDCINLKKIILSDPMQQIETIMDYHYVSLSPYDDREKAVQLMQKVDVFVLPVVGSDGVLLGIVTADDVLDVAQEEATEDIQKSASIEPLEISYTKSSPFLLYRKRVIWLLVLLLADFLSSGVIAAFSGVLQAFIVLSFFIPVLIDSGGNTGTQSATLIIRGLALGEIDFKQWWKILLKEIGVGLLLGITLGFIVFLRGYFWKGNTEVAFVIGLSMIVLVIWANLIGSMLPLALSKFRIDPAVVSGPFITSIVDASGLFIYFYIAKLILHV